MAKSSVPKKPEEVKIKGAVAPLSGTLEKILDIDGSAIYNFKIRGDEKV